MEELERQYLSFFLAEETGELHARFDPAAGKPAPDLATVQQTLLDAGWGDLYLDEKALAAFVIHCRVAKAALDLIIGGRRDAEFSLSVADDLMAAWLTLIPAQGGEPLGAAVSDAMLEQGIVHGILHHQLDAALATGKCEHLLIARGDPPFDGITGRFENLFEGKQIQAVEEDELAIIKYSDLSHLLLVHAGDQLMRRIPSIPGKSGLDIRQQVVLAKPIPELLFAENLQGAAPDPNDPDLLVATCAGQPVAVANGVYVNPVIEVPDVDLSTGNIAFEGTIRIAGDIKAGMRLSVSGDVIVNGTVEAAEIIAGGNVAVHGGIIGHADSRPGSHSLPANTARVRCEGAVQALFMENAHIEAGGAILVERSARQCELIARDEIVIGQGGSKVGQLIGGVAQAMNSVKVAVLGSSAGAKTLVQVGFDPYLDDEIVSKEHLLQHKLDELDQVIKLIVFLEKNPQKRVGGVGEKVEGTRRQLTAEIQVLTGEVSELREKLESVEHAFVEVGKTIHYGVEIHIGQHLWHPTDDMAGTTIRLEGEQIVAGES